MPSVSRTPSKMLSVFTLCAAIGGAAQSPPALPPVELVRRVVANETKTNDQTIKFMFRQRKETPNGSQTKLMVQTREAIVGMVVANDDHPLDLQQRRGEFGRVERFINEPDELERKQKKEKEDAERIHRILRALPDAFLYEYDGTEMGRADVGKPGDELVRLKFRPNPKYEPPTRVEQVLTGMKGVVLIDPREQHIAQIDGTLMKDVTFGWGILGHLDKGGHFLVKQCDVMNDNWAISRMELEFTGKILLFKSINIKSTEVYSDFRPVPVDLTFAQGVYLLKKEAITVAQNQ
jgi:hypothetical protein